MMKQLRLMMLMLLCAVVSTTWAEDVQKSISAANILVATETDPFTITTEKNSGSTAPTYNTGAEDYRIYAKGSISISSTSATIKSIVFNLSAQGKKRLAPITADNGTVAAQTTGDEAVTWTGSATSVVLTVGDKADYGSDGDTKAGQLCFTSIDIVYEASGETPPVVTIPVPTFNPESGAEVKVGDQITINTTATGDNAGIIYSTDGISVDGQTEAFGFEYAQTVTITITEGMVKDGKVSIHAESFVGNDYSDEVEAVYTIKEEEEPTPGGETEEGTAQFDFTGTASKYGWTANSGNATTGISSAAVESPISVTPVLNDPSKAAWYPTTTNASGNTTKGTLRIYKGNTLTVGALNDKTKIIKIEFEASTWAAPSSNVEGSFSGKEWTPSNTAGVPNVMFTFGNGASRINTMTVTYLTEKEADEVSVIINRHMYATYSNGEKALDLSQLPEGLTAYKVTELTKDYTIIEEISEPVPANTGLLFKGAEIGEYKVPVYADEATAPADNILLATSAIQDGSVVAGAPSVWALGVRATDAKVGFMQVTEGTSITKGNKAYIINNDISEYNEAAVAAFLLYNEETPAETTAIESVNTQVIDGRAPMYNLAGQRVGRDYRGIVIQNGKKFIK